ncbi:GAF and ANTAR domain-containing protein [Streptomyces sp. NPDC005485]|uniref:GAF and ANTAR domain-containing protein n=1 Tax=Streptomyces sp. NPDC005485 TaxID=3155591 RepID=UPI0033BEFB7E
MAPPVHEHQAAEALLALAAAPHQGEDEGDLLRRLACSAVHVTGADAAGCSLADGGAGRPHRLAGSDDIAVQLEHDQVELQEGPGLDTVRSGRPLTDLPMVRTHGRIRWPRFTRRALDAGFTALSALPLTHQDRVFGALVLYHRQGVMHPEDVRWSRLLADAAGVGLAHRSVLHEAQCRTEQLQAALHSRIAIEQAKGMLAERLGCTSTEAFALMRRHARTHRVKVTDLSAEIVRGPADTGPFPKPPH